MRQTAVAHQPACRMTREGAAACPSIAPVPPLRGGPGTVAEQTPGPVEAHCFPRQSGVTLLRLRYHSSPFCAESVGGPP